MKQGEIPVQSGCDDKQAENIRIASLYPSLQRYGRFLAQNQWDGDDIAQEAIVRAFCAYKPCSINQALLKKIAYNCWMDTVRKRKREQLVEEPEEDSERKNSGLVEHLLSQLTLKQAVIFALKEGFQYKSKEIAEIMQTTEFAVKSSLNRARKQLNHPETDERKVTFAIEEEEKVSQLLQESLATEDPSILLKAIPALHSLKSQAVSTPVLSVKQAPSNTLCMAA
ncbi:sigma factor-like helix-turn-helix DNA-binding protein [Cytobacillus oceanisediminis]|uniref:sigma factor-like helix-turn-helix DNA-binding protein n=1 Tax=Cytobacillus oceanisediminis TaxID=665099 RepID=UPI00373689BE